MLTISQVSKSFGARTLFSDVSLQVNRGNRIGLIGPNGAGKSTLFSLILGQDSPDEGIIALQKSARIGYLPQERDPLRNLVVAGLSGRISRDCLLPNQIFCCWTSQPITSTSSRLDGCKIIFENTLALSSWSPMIVPSSMRS
jgi:ATP-binding cassette subfamily F protein 3